MSFVEKFLKKNSGLKEKAFEEHKINSLKIAVVFALFAWLIIGVLIANILKALAFSVLVGVFLFVLLIQLPIAKKKKYAKIIEAQLPFFVIQLATELRTGKDFRKALEDSCKENNAVSKEYLKVVEDLRKGAGFGEALKAMNERIGSELVKRVNANLINLQLHGRKDVSGLKKISQELLAKQRIESKEFSSKMALYALVFVAVSAIIPAMFISFVLVGSYFMSLSFTKEQVFLVSAIGFPLIDSAILLFINSKTPEFLKA